MLRFWRVWVSATDDADPLANGAAVVIPRSPRGVLAGAVVGFIRYLTTKYADNPLT